MKKLAIPFVIILVFIGLALVAYDNGYGNEQSKAPLPPTKTTEPVVGDAQAEVAQKERITTSVGELLHTAQKAPTPADTATAVISTVAPMDHTMTETMHMADGHTADTHMATDHMAADHGVPAEAVAVKNPIPASAESSKRGAALFSQSCAVCHGNTGEGNGPGAAGLNPKPADLHADHVQDNSDGTLFWIISHGRTGTAMPAWNTAFSDPQRWDLVNFLRTFRGK